MWDKISCRTEGVRHITESLQKNILRPWRMLIPTLDLEWIMAPRKPQCLQSRKFQMEVKRFYTSVFCNSWKLANVFPLPWHIVLSCLRIKLYRTDNMRLVNSLRRAYKWWDEPFLIAQVQMAMLNCCVCLFVFVCMCIQLNSMFWYPRCFPEKTAFVRICWNFCAISCLYKWGTAWKFNFLFQLWNTEGKRAEKYAKSPKQIIGKWDL